MPCSTAPISPSDFRQALGHFASGLTVITSSLEQTSVGFTCQSFYSVSMAPPLVSFSVMAGSASYPLIREAGRFAVNILSAEQAPIANQFARRGADKWQGVAAQRSPLGNPLIAGSLHWLDCHIVAEHLAGDHLIVIGEVNALGQPVESGEPLLYFKGEYGQFDAAQLS